MMNLCTWCDKDLAISSGENESEAPISHGICEQCFSRLFVVRGVEFGDFLESLRAPVAVVDEFGLVQAANLHAQMLLNKSLERIQGQRGGNVFECIHSLEPGGCGHTIHCAGCAINRTVMETMYSGESRSGIPAFVDQPPELGGARLKLLISTEKIGGVVLLRIDEFESVDARA